MNTVKQTIGDITIPSFEELQTFDNVNKILNLKYHRKTKVDTSSVDFIILEVLKMFKFLYKKENNRRYFVGIHMETETVEGKAIASPIASIVYNHKEHGLRKIDKILDSRYGNVPVSVIEAYTTIIRKIILWKNGDIKFDDLTPDNFIRLKPEEITGE